MDFEDIKNMDIERLEVVPEEVGEGDPDAKDKLLWEKELNPEMEEFKIDHTKTSLSTGKIVIPVFRDTELVPLSYEDRQGKIYKSRGNYVDYRIEYDFGHLMKITQNFYIRTFKSNDEKFPQDHLLRENIREIYLKYEFYPDGTGQWKHFQDVDTWNQLREELDEIKDEKEKDKGRTFYKLYREFRQKSKAGTPTDVFENLIAAFGFYEKLLDSTVEYFEVKCEINDISQQNFHLIKSQIEKVKPDIEEKFHIAMDQSAEFFKQRESAIDANSILKRLYSPGYWVEENQVFANAAEHFALHQFSNDNRNEHTKLLLKKALIQTANGKDTFVSLDSVPLKNELEKIKKTENK